MANSAVKYLVFDVESVADGDLISRIRYAGEGLSPEKAIAKYRAELMEKFGNDFIPYTFQLPISIVVAKVDSKFRLTDIVSLDAPEFRPHVIIENFWRGWEGYNKPTLVSFNGRTFDIPLLELAAFRFGLSIPAWFNVASKSFEQFRNRYNVASHLDLHDVLTNYGASRFNGGLNLAANLIGKPGKMSVQGDMVQDLYDDEKFDEINDYCRCDVLDTYFVFLRGAVLIGWINLDQEQQIVEQTKKWLQERAGEAPVYADYLRHWGDWNNPWLEEGEIN